MSNALNPLPADVDALEASDEFARSSLLAPRYTATPTRHSNPFATCWTQPGAIPFRFPDGLSANSVFERLDALGWRGAIVGPHGSGKSTLLETLKPDLRSRGWNVQAMTIRNNGQWESDQRTVHAHASSASSDDAVGSPGALPQPPRRRMWIIDGYEQLGRFQRFRLLRRARRSGSGLLVTAHGPTNVPTLLELRPKECLIQSLVADLSARVSTAVTPADVVASHACHGSNVRDIFFDLYDLHERSRRVLLAGNIH